MKYLSYIVIWTMALTAPLLCLLLVPIISSAQIEVSDTNSYSGGTVDDGTTYYDSSASNQDTINQYNALRNDTVGRTDPDTADPGYVSPSSPSNQDYANFYNNNSVTGGKTGSDITTGGKTGSDITTGGKTGSSQGSSELVNPLKSKSIEEFLLKIIDVLLVFAVPIIVLYIMYAGYLFVTAQGEPGKVSAARQALLWSVVGGVIVLGAKIIITVIQGTITAF